MNIILFETAEDAAVIKKTDPRSAHVKQVLKMSVGDTFFVGIVNGQRGRATIVKADEDIDLSIDWEHQLLESLPISLLVGLPRPQTARKILQECTGLGVRRIIFFQSEKGEKSYRESKLWQSNEWRRHLLQGAEQAFSTTIPEVIHVDSLNDFFENDQAVALTGKHNWALDIYEASDSFAKRLYSTQLKPTDESMIAIGPERGWSVSERDLLRKQHFELLHFGERVLRTETASVLSVGILAGAYGFKPFEGLDLLD